MLDISLLGPNEVRVSGVSVSLSPLERNLLAVLALSRGVVISTDRIIDYLWADRVPAAPRSRVQGLVSSLRRKIGDALVTRHPGYLIEASGTTIDLDECENYAREAREALSPSTVAKYLRLALELWRGEPLDGVSAPGIEIDRVRLTEMRLGLVEERFEADLELGLHAEVVADLAAAAAAHPLRERLAGQLMLALYRCNRQADAITVYRALRERLADELGSDPCVDLRNLHATILRGEPIGSPAADPTQELVPIGGSGAGPTAWAARGNGAAAASVGGNGAAEAGEARPASLPAGVGHFTGRDAEIAELSRAISWASNEPRVLFVTGAGGIGKTATVLQWAHTVADRIPDGQIFVALHGQDAQSALSANDVLGVALAALGVPLADVPPGTDERAARYRTLVSGRRMLIVADDAGAAEPLLALVPPGPASQLVATSRRRLVALAAHHAVESIPLHPLSPPSTHELLARIVGPERMREPGADAVVAWCGGWPLITRLAGTRLAARPWQSMESFADELDELTNEILEDDPRSVRAALISAHAAVSPAAAHLFARLGLSSSSLVVLHHSTGLGQPTTNPGSSLRRVRRLLDELVAVHLMNEVGPDRYQIHDVVRRFAQQCAAELVDRDAVDEWMRRGMAESHPI